MARNLELLVEDPETSSGSVQLTMLLNPIGFVT
ncbi:MAG: hypothetical protein ACJAZK_001129 [Psychroserpens sp.]|jgi:hypothetical protein